jgi:hypothetical protein
MSDVQSSETVQLSEWIGAEVFDAHGDRVGKLAAVYSDDLALVKTGLFGLRSSFVPAAGASLEGDALVLPYEKSQIREAPALPKGEQEISPEEETAVYSHYGLSQPPRVR